MICELDSRSLTQLLIDWRQGQSHALDQLIENAYAELRRIGQQQMRRERGEHTLQATALVNEAYLRLVELRQIDWRDRGHFFAVAAGVMRRVLVDQARNRHTLKRGGSALRVTLDEELPAPDQSVDLIALDNLLKHLAKRDEIQARIVELRYFGGLTIEETAAALGIAPVTVKRKWALAQAWLYRELNG